MKPRISMIMLGIDDIEKFVAFYRDGLGFSRSKGHQRLPSLLLPGHGSVFMVLADDAQLPGQGSEFNSFALAHSLYSEAEVDMLMSEVVRAGAELVKPPQNVFRGSCPGY